MRVWSVCSRCSCRVASKETGRAGIWTSPPAAYHNFLPSEHLTSLLRLYITAPDKKGERKWRQKTLKKRRCRWKRRRGRWKFIKALYFFSLSWHRNAKRRHVYVMRNIFYSSFTVSQTKVLFSLMNVEDQCVWEDQHMIWGPIGGTGGLIHKFGSKQ